MGPDRGSLRFPPTHRLRKRREFLRVQRRGKRIWGRRFIFYLGRPSKGQPRLGVTVSKKVGNAVRRNRIKRWVREVFRNNPQVFGRPMDLVLIAKRDVDDFSYATIESEFLHVLSHYFRRSGGGPERQAGGEGESRGC